jgi:hypothetical protein
MLALVVLRVPSQRPTLLQQSRPRRRGADVLKQVDEVTDDVHVDPRVFVSGLIQSIWYLAP